VHNAEALVATERGKKGHYNSKLELRKPQHYSNLKSFRIRFILKKDDRKVAVVEKILTD
jgi:hypothetical protein